MFDGCIYFNTQALARQLERIWTAAFRPFELTPPQGFMLRAILDNPGILPSDLADSLKIARATATRALDGLEAKGLVERRPAKRDGRECEVLATPAAQAIKERLNAASSDVTKRLKGKLGASEFAAFVTEARTFSSRLG